MASKPDGVTALEAKLDTLIRLQATALTSGYATQKEKISFLDRAGLGPKAISEILGTSTNTVNVALSKMRKKDAQAKE